eukprot:756461-Hanusia_phi.AAC.2
MDLQTTSGVTSRFFQEIFHDAGVARENIHVIPEAVDTKIFDPSKASSWETRKGWDILIEAFLSQFPARDNKVIAAQESAVLYIKTMHYHTDGDFKQKILKFASEALGLNDPSQHNCVRPGPCPGGDGSTLCRTSPPLVDLPHCGSELGLLRPALTGRRGLEPVRQGAFVGHMWAKPSVKGLKSILQQIFDNPGQARKKAQVGMREVRELYNPSAVSQVVIRRLQEIEQLVSKRSPEGEL